MIHEYQLRILPEQAASEQSLKQYIGREKGLDVRTINAIRILKRSIDARQRTIYVNLTIRVFVNETPSEEEFVRTDYPNVEGRPAVIVVGAGPGGLFAALKLIELGLRPIVVERGKNVRERKEDLARISREHKVDAESNYSFGEGGAGAYSDGKLYTRSKKRGSVEKILNVFCQHGASPTILSDAHPHIGTDKLPRVIENMRNTILACGGEVHFQTRMESILIEGQKVKGIETNTGKTFLGPVILATGHSARDIYELLDRDGVRLEAKAFAMGARVEHPQQLIDSIQYHMPERGEYLPAAAYSLVAQVNGRGVYSFCMCPGGEVIAAASEPGGVCTNGMSNSRRNGENANSALLVTLSPEDFPYDGPLGGMYWQRDIERAAFKASGSYHAPAQTVGDFIAHMKSEGEGGVLPSYRPGVFWCDLHDVLPERITSVLENALPELGRKLNGFDAPDAVLTAPETRSSSPVRILRDERRQSQIRGLYPCGEGAGYAGGITSAAVDGMKCAEAVIQSL